MARLPHDDRTTAMLKIDGIESGRLKSAAFLTVLGGLRQGEMLKISGELILGRGEGAGLRLSDHGVSREHVRFTPGEKGVLLEDLQSSNGTFVNGKRVTSHTLEDGDTIQVGSEAILKFSYADELESSFQQKMYQAAVRDPLTKLFNRRYLFEQLRSEFAFTGRHQTPLSLILMDIDHFKRINDTHGHAIGDAVLTGFAEMLLASIREEDVAARIGGEEFVLTCRGIRPLVGVAVADRLRKSVEAGQLVPGLPDLKVTFSAGVAGIPNPRYLDPETLLAAADGALYVAKGKGRNQVCAAKNPV